MAIAINLAIDESTDFIAHEPVKRNFARRFSGISVKVCLPGIPKRNIDQRLESMGLARAAVHLLLNEAARRPFQGSILTLGRQHVYVTSDEVNQMAEKQGVALRVLPVELHKDKGLAQKGYVSDEWLLKSLGFDQIVRVDYSNYEDVDLILDLNDPETPSALHRKFDVVLDSGTLEHVFDIAAGLRHCVRMVKPEGRIIHLTPSSNCVEHGFYSVSPTLFADFYSACDFEVDRIWLCEIPIDLPRGEWTVYDYLGSSERFISLGQLSDNIWFTFSVTTASSSPKLATPQQAFYTSTWQRSSSTYQPSAPSLTQDKEGFSSTRIPVSQQFQAATESYSSNENPVFEEGSKSQKLIQCLKPFPPLQRQAIKTIQKWRKYRHNKEIRLHRLPYPLVGKF